MDIFNIYNILIIIVFVIGYALITVEHVTKLNKTSIALLMAILCWALVFLSNPNSKELSLSYLNEHVANVSQIVFFLLGALAIVEIVSVHKGFEFITNYVQLESKQQLLWLIAFITFFLSAVLDNLTTTIIMVTLIRKLIPQNEDRLLMGGGIVIAANAGEPGHPLETLPQRCSGLGGN